MFSSQTLLFMFVSSGGLDALTELLDPDVATYKELILVAIDSFAIIFKQNLLSNM